MLLPLSSIQQWEVMVAGWGWLTCAGWLVACSAGNGSKERPERTDSGAQQWAAEWKSHVFHVERGWDGVERIKRHSELANKAVNNNNLENIITVTDCCQGRHGPVHGIVLLFCSKDAADVAPDVVAAQETFSIKFKTSCGSHYTRWYRTKTVMK